MQVLIVGLVAQVVSQILKIPFYYFRRGKWDFTQIKISGGMPSSHTSFIVAAACFIGFQYGFMDPLFGVATIMAFIIIYDALNVRYQAGQHASILNKHLSKDGENFDLPEDLGHTKREVAAGIVVGLIIGYLFAVFY